MPKKQKISKRLDGLFKDVKPEENPGKRGSKPGAGKDAPPPQADASPASSVTATPVGVPKPDPSPKPASLPAPTPAKTSRRHTGTLLPLSDPIPSDSSPGSAYSTTLQLGEENWAILRMVDENQGRTFTTDEQLLIRQVTDQLSLALENAQLFQETKKRAEETAVLNELGRALASRLTLDQVVSEVYRGVRRLLNAKNFYIAFYDRENKEILFPQNVTESATDLNITRMPLGQGITAHMISTGESVLITNGTDEWSKERGLIPAGEPAKSYLGTPILVGNEAIGALAVQDYQEYNVYTQDDLELLQAFANQASIAIQNARLFEEISERQKAQERSEANLRTLFSAMDDVVLVINSDGRYEQIAPTNPSLLVRPPDEMLGKIFHEFLPQDIADNFLGKVREALSSDEKIAFEYELNIGGQPLWFLANLTKLDNTRVFWIARDITERKKAEEAIRRRNEYLAVSAEIGKLVTSILDLNTIFARTVNLITERFDFYHAAIYIVEETGFKLELKEATGEAGAEMKEQEHKLRLDERSIVGSVASTGSPLVANNVLEHPLYAASPLLSDTRAEAAIPLRIGPRIIGVIDIQAREINAFNEDEISVLQTLADQVAVAIDNARSFELSQQAVMEMREADRLKSQFLANMSHELRTPLNSIIGFSRVILKGIDGPVTELMQQDLTAIYNSGQHLLGLINDILDQAKIEAGKMELAFDEVNVGDLIHSVLSTMSGIVKDKPIELRQFVAPETPAVRADAIRIRQVMINLISNAVKFTEEGSITVNVEPYRQDGRRLVRISVIDTGPGISPRDQEKLFQAFSQVDASPTRKSGGTGLGLSICKQLINMHGGEIWVESEINKGSAFHFTLPLYHKELEAEVESHKTILTIDDDPQVIGLYQRYLHPEGFRVEPLTDPARAVEAARRVKPFAITLDIMMPGTDGWTVLDALKSNAETRNIPVIICSIVEDIEKGFHLGASDYLVKPILEEDLVNSLDRLNADGSIREVLVIDDNPNDVRLIGKMLIDDGRYKPILAEGGQNGWAALSSGNPPHAIILDLFMPEMDGFQILEQMQADRRLRDIPTIVISGMDITPEQKNQLKEFGQRLLTKGAFTEKELLTSLQRSLERLKAGK
ncbi:MAG: hypothetical protein DCC59_07935 [Chloroflexi bacterium]|nr:GAF domain-containing protein [Chloroflexi bacterium CFX1]MCK6566421.1 GAF domain-containing protein [Anaerolineales bacterium]MCQ3951673.1 hypothetical protein [Chloroflexota bacterium]MDL1919020.1 GAF domain-containing protein [Chloroflexi bacterium CFX5]NUQ57825.1 GAF domain-containing protein [Anaerolineales bacterium]